jgi:hypothetical protein
MLCKKSIPYSLNKVNTKHQQQQQTNNQKTTKKPRKPTNTMKTNKQKTRILQKKSIYKQNRKA